MRKRPSIYPITDGATTLQSIELIEEDQELIGPGLLLEGRYRIERQIGSGGMGAVWMATQLMVERKVAIKFLKSSLSQHDIIRARFEVEAKAIGRLNHPNCITLHDFGYSTDIDAFFTVMEYVQGVSLVERLGGSLGWREVVEVVRQVALALDHAHHQGILHRDLKPENVMLTQMTDGSLLVKVLDFGIARIFRQQEEEEELTPTESARLTRAGEVFGTPAYISPEQARGIRDLTPACDLYSLGIMFYELLEGRLPFMADTPIDIMMMHLREAPPSMKRPVPQEVREVVLCLLAKRPEDRFDSGLMLAKRLQAILDGEASSAGVTGEMEPVVRQSLVEESVPELSSASLKNSSGPSPTLAQTPSPLPDLGLRDSQPSGLDDPGSSTVPIAHSPSPAEIVTQETPRSAVRAEESSSVGMLPKVVGGVLLALLLVVGSVFGYEVYRSGEAAAEIAKRESAETSKAATKSVGVDKSAGEAGEEKVAIKEATSKSGQGDALKRDPNLRVAMPVASSKVESACAEARRETREKTAAMLEEMRDAQRKRVKTRRRGRVRKKAPKDERAVSDRDPNKKRAPEKLDLNKSDPKKLNL